MKSLSPKARFSLVLASVFLVGLLLGAIYVQATAPSGTFFISQGIYPGAPSYTIWKEGSTYYAKDAYGQIDFSGTNANQIIQNTVANNIEVVLVTGTYNMLDNLQVSNIYNFTLRGPKSAYLTTSTYDADAMINIMASKSISIIGFTMDGTNILDTLINIKHSQQIFVSDMKFVNCKEPSAGSPILIDKSMYVTVENNYFDTGQGVELFGQYGSVNNTLISNNVFKNSDYGVHGDYNVYDNVITGNIMINVVSGVYLTYTGRRNIIADNHIEASSVGIRLSDLFKFNSVSGNTIYTSDNGIIIRAQSNENTVVGNTILNRTSSETYGIFLDYSDLNIISANVVSGNFAIGVYIGGGASANIGIGINTYLVPINQGILIQVGSLNNHINLSYNSTTWIP